MSSEDARARAGEGVKGGRKSAGENGERMKFWSKEEKAVKGEPGDCQHVNA